MPADKMEPESVRAALAAAFPCPEELFGRAWHLQETAGVLGKLAAAYTAESAKIAAELYAAGMTSPNYTVDVPVKMQTTVDISKLKDELPQVAGNLLYVSSTNAVKLIGERRLYELAIEIAGDSRVALVEQVRIEDLRKALLAEELGRYVSEEEIPGDRARISCREGGTTQ